MRIGAPDVAAPEAAGAEPTSPRDLLRRFLQGDLASLRVILAIAVIWVIFDLQNERFLSAANLTNLFLQITAVGLIAVGVVMVLLIGEIDLSVGATSVMHDRRRLAIAIEIAVETTPLARVTGRAGRLDQGDEGVPVAVVAQLAQLQHVSRGFPLAPDLLPRAAVEMQLPGLGRQPQRLLVGVRQSQHLTGLRILGHHGYQTPLIELKLFEHRVQSYARRFTRFQADPEDPRRAASDSVRGS